MALSLWEDKSSAFFGQRWSLNWSLLYIFQRKSMIMRILSNDGPMLWLHRVDLTDRDAVDLHQLMRNETENSAMRAKE